MSVGSGVVDTSVFKGVADLHAGVMSEDPVVAPAHEVVQDSDMVADPSIPPAHADAGPEHGGDTAAHPTEDASAGDAGHTHADLAYADADHAYADPTVADTDHSYAEHAAADMDHAYADHAYADATVPDSAVSFADHSMMPADDGTPHSLGADAGQGQGDSHFAGAWWWAGGIGVGAAGIGYVLAPDHHDDVSTSGAAAPDVHVVVESHGAFIDANEDGVYEAGSEQAVFQGAGANADLVANHVTIHFNDVPGGDNEGGRALNLTGFGDDDKIVFHVEAMMGDNYGGRHILDASAASISSVDLWTGHVSYEFHGATEAAHASITVHSVPVSSASDFSGHWYDGVYALSIDNIASSIRVSSGTSGGIPWAYSTTHAVIAYWTDSENALNQHEALFPNGTASRTHLINFNENGNAVVDFIWPAAYPVG